MNIPTSGLIVIKSTDNKSTLPGSDCGRVFIWDKYTSEVITALKVDPNTSLSVKPHPFDPVLACSGLDKSVKILEPNFEVSIEFKILSFSSFIQHTR